MRWFQEWKKQRDCENDLVDTIIKSMRENPRQWNIDKYHANFGRLSIWIENSPYADMTLNSRRLPRRGELRKALAYCLMEQARLALQKV